jgi:hypothetical protein
VLHQIIRQQSSFRGKVVGALLIAGLFGGFGLFHVFANLTYAVLLVCGFRVGGNLFQVGICRSKQLTRALALARGLLRAHARGKLGLGISCAAVAHYFFSRRRSRRPGGSFPAAFLAGRFRRRRSRIGLGLAWLGSGLRGWRRLGLRRWPGLRFCAGLRGLDRRTWGRAVLPKAESRTRQLSFLAESSGWCRDDRLDRGSRQRTQSENQGQILTHLKFDASNYRETYPEF